MQHKEKLVSFQAVSSTLINKVRQHVRRRRHPCSLVNELETTCMANLSTTGVGRRRNLRLTRTSYTGCVGGTARFSGHFLSALASSVPDSLQVHMYYQYAAWFRLLLLWTTL